MYDLFKYAFFSTSSGSCFANGNYSFQAMPSCFVGFMTCAQYESRTDTADV
ncbi:MAG: hypothetical protein WBJ52_02120 [Methanoregulaceae archaeon]